jgi:soluble lytic murein transglycosylase-like protein
MPLSTPTLARALVACATAFAVCAPAVADIYMHTAESGEITLSNVPSHAGFERVLAEPAPVPLAAPAAVRKAVPLDARVPYAPHIAAAARTHGLPEELLAAVIWAESNYNPKATSKKGAKGLMQLMPETARRMGVRDAYDPAENIAGGARYLRQLLDQFNSDLPLALAAYNAGPNAVLRHGTTVPPYAETRAYVPKVIGLFERLDPSN